MLVISSKPGQLGNMLFTFANVIASAYENNLEVANPAFEDYAKHFISTSSDVLCRYPPKNSVFADSQRFRKLSYNVCSSAARLIGKIGNNLPFFRVITLRDWDVIFDLNDPSFVKTQHKSQVTFLRGWAFRASQLLEKHRDVVRQYFRPLEKYERNVADLIEKARKDVDVLVGVHIRQGIIDFANAIHYYHTPEKYADFMDQMERLLDGKRVGFLICSDRKLDPANYSRFHCTYGTNDLIEDLYAFSKCDYLIGPPSTYTMWASFYGDVPLNLIADSNRPVQFEDFTIRY
jgi:hypothetical protein